MSKKLERSVKEHLRAVGERNLSKYDKMLRKIFLGKELNENEKGFNNRYKRIVALRNNGYNKHLTSQLIANEFSIEYETAYKAVNEAEKIFGEYSDINKQAERLYYANQLDEIARNAKKEKKFEFAAFCIEKAAKLKGLYETELPQNVEISMPIIQLTTNIDFAGKSILDIGNVEEVTDASTEEISN